MATDTPEPASWQKLQVLPRAFRFAHLDRQAFFLQLFRVFLADLVVRRRPCSPVAMTILLGGGALTNSRYVPTRAAAQIKEDGSPDHQGVSCPGLGAEEASC